jgi:hypothetical protein
MSTWWIQGVTLILTAAWLERRQHWSAPLVGTLGLVVLAEAYARERRRRIRQAQLDLLGF